MDPDEVAALLRDCSCCSLQRERRHASGPLRTSPSHGLLPDVKNLKYPPTTPFTKLLFNREYVLLMNELLALREDLIGAKVIIAKIAQGLKPADLRSLISCRQDDASCILMRIHFYVRDAAWCDAGLRHRGLLPAVPEVPVVPFVTALKAKAMDWSEVFEYVERERREGILKGDGAWADPRGDLHKRLLRALGALNTKFIDLVKVENSLGLFSEDDPVRLLPQEGLDPALNNLLMPIRNHARASPHGLENMPIEVLEEFHTQGRRVRRHLAAEARKVGNIYFQRFSAATDPKAKEDFVEDVMLEYLLAIQEMEQTPTVCANIAALYLATKDYPSAIQFAKRGLGAFLLLRAEPATYAARRAVTIEELRTGEGPEVPKVPYRKQSKTEKKAERMVMRKLYLRKGRAEAAQVVELMAGRTSSSSFTQQQQDEVRKLFLTACHSYQGCHLLDMTDKATSKEMRDFVEKVEAVFLPGSL